MKTHFANQMPNAEYRDFKTFSNNLFRRDTQEILSPEDIFHNDQIYTIMCNFFNRHALLKKKSIFELIKHLP